MGSFAPRYRRLALLCSMALAGAAFVSAGTPNLVAVDALGRTIGPVTSYNPASGTLRLSMQFTDATVYLRVTGDVFTHDSRPLVYFESTDCTGAPYMMVAQSLVVPGEPWAVAGVDQTLYRGDLQTRTSRVLKSALWTESCKSVDIQMEVMDATPVVDLGFEFLPPYRAVPASGRAESRKPTPEGNSAGDESFQDVERR